MDIIKSFLDSDNGIIDSIAEKVGLDKEQISGLVEGLVPELNNGVQSKISEGATGIQSLIDGLDLSSLSKLVGGSDKVEDTEASSMGETLLKNILGGEQGLGDVISNLTSSTGISAEKITQAMPSLTTAFMSFFSNSAGGLGDMLQGFLGGEGGSMLDNVTNFLDKDGDGKVVDDLLDAAKKLL